MERLVVTGLQPNTTYTLLNVTALRSHDEYKSTTNPIDGARYNKRKPGAHFSRRADVWSIGVILLEFIIWLFHGFA